MVEGFSVYGKIVHDWFVGKGKGKICANAGDMFIEYEKVEEAVAAFEEMNGRMYDEREIRLYFVPREFYYMNFQKGLDPTKKHKEEDMKEEVKAEGK